MEPFLTLYFRQIIFGFKNRSIFCLQSQKELWVWVWKLWVTDWRLWYWICPRWNWTKYTMHSCERIENVNRYETGPNPDTRRPHPWLTTNVIPHYVDGRTKMLAWLRFSTKCRIPHFWYVFSSLLSDLGFLDRKRLSIFPYECLHHVVNQKDPKLYDRILSPD